MWAWWKHCHFVVIWLEANIVWCYHLLSDDINAIIWLYDNRCCHLGVGLDDNILHLYESYHLAGIIVVSSDSMISLTLSPAWMMKLILSSDWMTTFFFSFGVIVWWIITLILSSSWMITCSFSFGVMICLDDNIRCHYQAGWKHRSAAVGQSSLEWSFQQGYSLFCSFDFRENCYKNSSENFHNISQFSWANFRDNVKTKIIVSTLSFFHIFGETHFVDV